MPAKKYTQGKSRPGVRRGADDSAPTSPLAVPASPADPASPTADPASPPAVPASPPAVPASPAQSPLPPAQSPPHEAEETTEEGEEEEQPPKKKNYGWSLSDEQEQDLVEWLQANNFLWLRSSKYYHRKKQAWEQKALELGISLKHLQNWWKNVKDWFVKLSKKTSGQATRVLTDRDRWILKNIAFYKSKYISLSYI